MLGKVRKLRDNRFIRNVITVAFGSVGAQAITMALMPVVTRLYSPEAFGVLGAFAGIITVLMPVAALTYPMAIVLPKSDRDAIGLAKLSLKLALITSVIVALALTLFGGEIAHLLNATDAQSYLLLVPVAMFFSAIHQVTEQLGFRFHQFRWSAKAALLQSTLINTSKVAIGYYYPTGFALVSLQTITAATHGMFIWLGIRTTVERQVKKDYISKSTSAGDLVKTYSDFAKFRAPQVLINAISQSLPVLMLATFFGTVAAGYFALARTAVGIPSALLGKAVGDVFYPKISAAASNDEELYPLVKKAVLLLSAAGVIPFSVVIIFGPLLFSLVFGSEWETAGEYARWLAVWMFFMYINSPAVKSIAVVEKQELHLLFTCITVAIRAASLYLGYSLYNDEILAIAVFSTLSAILNVLLIGLAMFFCKKFDTKGQNDG